jgi:hypothetical protein
MGRMRSAKAHHVRAVELGIVRLLEARDLFKQASCPKTLARIRLALSSAKGAQRHVRHRAMGSPR